MPTPETLAGIDYERLKNLFQQQLALYSSLDPSERIVRQLFWRDDMEDYTTMKWDPYGTAAYVNNVIPPFEGDYVLQIRHATSTEPFVRVRFGAFSLGKHSVELRWYKMSYLINTAVVMNRDSPIAPERLRSRLSYIMFSGLVGGRWRYRDSAGVLKDIPGATEYIRDNTWNYLKIVTDWRNERLDRLITNSLDLDLSSLNLGLQKVTLASIVGMTELNLVGYSEAVNEPFYFDDVRIYLNEV